MALLPSGSAPNDVELVYIDTDQLTLVIKGKPYHERYEGLLQYRQLDFHDVMHFNVRGKYINIKKIFDVETQTLIEPLNQRPIFFENGNYQIVISPKAGINLSFYHEHPLLRKAVGKVDIGDSYFLMGNLQFQNEVGLSKFEIRSEEGVLLEVTIEIFPSKLDYKDDYKTLLNEVNNEIYNLAYHFIKKTYFGAKVNVEGKPSRSEFYRLLTYHFEGLFNAIKQIESQPHRKLITTHIHARGDQLGKLDQRGRQYLRKRPHLFVDVERGIEINNRIVLPKSGLKIKKELTPDTLENQFIKWIMSRLQTKIADLLDKVLSKNKRYEVEPDQDLVHRIEKMLSSLDKRMKNSFWNNIGKLDRSVMSLVIQMAPGYRDVFKTYLIISKGLSLQGTLYQMSVKDVATMYEYWTFIKLGQILNKKYKMLSQDIIKVKSDGLFVNLDTNSTAKRVFKHPITNEQIILTYQKTERHLPTLPQKPDTTLSIEKKGKNFTYNYIFDAKYRIDFAVEGSYYQRHYQEPGPMEDDINTMHRYRDSLVVQQNGPYERTAFGAYVLFPWKDEELYENHHFYKSIGKVNIGGLPFLPNATRLVEQFIEHLIEKSPEEIQKEGILPRGSKEVWISALDDKVLVGTVTSKEYFHRFINHLYFRIPSNKLKRGWQEAAYVALYLVNGVSSQNGIVCYGKITEVKFVKGFEIDEPPTDSYEEYVIFNIDVWKTIYRPIIPVGYGISIYSITTLSILRDAKELPEIFMKSKEERIIWRMLRRISDQITIELDAPILDQATKIQRFRFNNILVNFNNQERQMTIIHEKGEKVIDYDELIKKPSGVFRKIISLIELGL
ncbi:restriction endonuclease-like protein [Fredinandcohnia onubensis]|uniref:restriction endonuclease-like protein n=1 Tax=Fredinandcohnia onubensis TaxID=1571209 RepID=UPI000C0BF388|nr:restriction endonuclease-like protein [Fredinandcohnia onubensis]